MTIRIETSLTGREVRLSVRDTGPGFPPERLADPAAAFASGKGSTGLGLSLCDRIARVHGGQLSLSNHAEGGAVITLSLPLPGTEDPAPAGAPSSAAETSA